MHQRILRLESCVYSLRHVEKLADCSIHSWPTERNLLYAIDAFATAGPFLSTQSSCKYTEASNFADPFPHSDGEMENDPLLPYKKQVECRRRTGVVWNANGVIRWLGSATLWGSADDVKTEYDEISCLNNNYCLIEWTSRRMGRFGESEPPLVTSATRVFRQNQ